MWTWLDYIPDCTLRVTQLIIYSRAQARDVFLLQSSLAKVLPLWNLLHTKRRRSDSALETGETTLTQKRQNPNNVASPSLSRLKKSSPTTSHSHTSSLHLPKIAQNTNCNSRSATTKSPTFKMTTRPHNLPPSTGPSSIASRQVRVIGVHEMEAKKCKTGAGVKLKSCHAGSTISPKKHQMESKTRPVRS